MSKGSTRSTLGLGERRQRALELFLQGRTVAEVAKELGCAPDTAARYREHWEHELRQQAENNPHLLRDFVSNTMRTLQELDLVRAKAWELYEGSSSESTKNQALNTALRAQHERAQLFGLLGVKPEFMAHVQQVRGLQERLIAWMRTELCPDCRNHLANFLARESGVVLPEQLPELSSAEVVS